MKGLLKYSLGGIYPLPEAAIDRFMLKVMITYPGK
jgi:MoxR-like ATPase